jgi:hypothetical protein
MSASALIGEKAGELQIELARFVEMSPNSQSGLPSALYVSDAALMLEKRSVFSKK